MGYRFRCQRVWGGAHESRESTRMGWVWKQHLGAQLLTNPTLDRKPPQPGLPFRFLGIRVISVISGPSSPSLLASRAVKSASLTLHQTAND